MSQQFFVVGATVYEGEKEDHTARFIQRGIWQMFYPEGEKPNYDQRIAKVKIGDRIAIKTMAGRGSGHIYIRAIGIVKAIIDTTLVVDWKLTNLNRKVESRGCYGTIHGPYVKDSWIRKIFSL